MRADLPREFFIGYMPLKHLPKDHCTREHIDFVVVFWVSSPKLGGLPIDGPHEAADHGTGRLLHLRQAEVGNFGNALCCDEDVGFRDK